MHVFLTGFGVSISLILAIGAQNAFVLKQGLQQRHVGLVVAICAVTDAVLIGAGVAGVGWIAAEAPWITTVLLFAGAAFLTYYGAKSFYAAWAGTGALQAAGAVEQSWQSAALTCVAVTWLNPHMYLDTVVLIGSVSSQYPDQRLVFWLGAALASGLFFCTLGYGARLLAPLFAKPRAWQVLDFGIGCVMWSIAFSLLMAP
ncbi:MAG: LysE/ArgO family amino acid transporter [Sulfitobacter sp.]